MAANISRMLPIFKDGCQFFKMQKYFKCLFQLYIKVENCKIKTNKTMISYNIDQNLSLQYSFYEKIVYLIIHTHFMVNFIIDVL